MNKEIIFSAKEYKEKYNDLLETYLSNGYEDLEQIDFIKSEILFYDLFKKISCGFKQNNFMAGRNLNDDYDNDLNEGCDNDLSRFKFQLRNKLYSIDNQFNKQIFEKIIFSFEKIIEFLELQKLNPTPQTPIISKTKTNKSLLFEGKDLNLSERFKIANKVLDIDKKIRTLNIRDLEKYQLLAYILGIDKDNARNLMNGTYKSKDRDLIDYFNDLDLNK